jgi:hypothetical protein
MSARVTTGHVATHPLDPEDAAITALIARHVGSSPRARFSSSSLARKRGENQEIPK